MEHLSTLESERVVREFFKDQPLKWYEMRGADKNIWQEVLGKHPQPGLGIPWIVNDTGQSDVSLTSQLDKDKTVFYKSK